MRMDNPEVGGMPQRNSDVFLIVSNSALVVFAVGFIWIASVFYREKVSGISLSESRFVTTEWSLLQELKVETDSRLMDKEREILTLRKRYLQLVQDPKSIKGLAELESQLRRAEEERRDILSLRLAAPASTEPAVVEEAVSPSPEQSATAQRSTPSSAASAIFQSRIMMLESQLTEEKALSVALSATLSSSNRERDLAARTFRDELALRDAGIEALSTGLSRLREAGRSAFEAASNGSQANDRQSQAIELDLNTKALLRAIASSPDIRARYPDLLASLDRYFDQFGLLERLTGRAEAYGAVVDALEPLAREIKKPVPR